MSSPLRAFFCFGVGAKRKIVGNWEKSSFYLRISRVARTLVNEIMSSVIKWPHGAKAQETSDAFGEITRFLNIFGAVDGSHIPIKAPRENPNGYYNRKTFPSVVL